jgi:hypothetical protein
MVPGTKASFLLSVPFSVLPICHPPPSPHIKQKDPTPWTPISAFPAPHEKKGKATESKKPLIHVALVRHLQLLDEKGKKKIHPESNKSYPGHRSPPERIPPCQAAVADRPPNSSSSRQQLPSSMSRTPSTRFIIPTIHGAGIPGKSACPVRESLGETPGAAREITWPR